MHRLTATFILAATFAGAVLIAPANAHASCADRKMTGTVLGGVGGALIGNSIARGGGGAILGGLGGAVLGHEIAGGGCHRERSVAYYRSRDRYRYAGEGPPQAERLVYYDQYGNPVTQTATDAAASNRFAAPGYAGPPPCQTEMQPYYDSRGAVVTSPVQICAR